MGIPKNAVKSTFSEILSIRETFVLRIVYSKTALYGCDRRRCGMTSADQRTGTARVAHWPSSASDGYIFDMCEYVQA